ncbi:MAG: endonuclease III [bacterium]|nr:endonuclease III [bacterium]
MPRESLKSKRARAATIDARLGELYPDARCSLTFRNPYELWVATVLSAQCTDERVNKVTPDLFAAAPDVEALAALGDTELEGLIRSTGFFRNKARNLLAAASQLLTEHDGEIPADLEALVGLPGIGRKTANVILGNAFNIPGMPVDTHIGRLSRRLRLTSHEDPVKVEFDLMNLFPAERWVMLGHRLISHGRAVCRSRKPDCPACFLAPHCPSSST